jgi:hypothetical protein
VPYADPEAQRRAKRESYARRKAAGRCFVVPLEPGSEPTAPARVPPSPADLSRVGDFLGVSRMAWESYEDFHERLRTRWQALLTILEG